MEQAETTTTTENWYAIRCRRESVAAEMLKESCADVFFPQDAVKTASGRKRQKAMIPHVLFIRTSSQRALDLERDSRGGSPGMVPFWIYRYPDSKEIQPIGDSEIRLLRLLSASDTSRCEIFTKTDYTPGQRVRVVGGEFAGYEGTVQRIRRNRHVVVQIEGICMIMLPFIHPDLLSAVE